jgi:hypothetical protein
MKATRKQTKKQAETQSFEEKVLKEAERLGLPKVLPALEAAQRVPAARQMTPFEFYQTLEVERYLGAGGRAPELQDRCENYWTYLIMNKEDLGGAKYG